MKDLEEKWDEVIKGEGYASGSIAEAMNYFVTKLEWKIDSISELSRSIHEFFQKI